MGTKHQRFRIDREFMRAIRATGEYQGFQDTELRGFGVKVTPTGSASYTYRWTKPDGKQGRLTIGQWPAMNPGDARDAARRESEVIDRKGDTLTMTATRKAKRTELAKAAVGSVPTVRAFLNERYEPYLRTHCKTADHGAANAHLIRMSFPDFLDNPLNEITGWRLEKWRSDRQAEGLTKTTTNKKLTALRGLLSRAIEWEVIDVHPMKAVKAQKEPSGRVRFLTGEEAERLYAALLSREQHLRDARDRGNAHRTSRRYARLPSLRKVEFVDYLRPAVLVSIMTGLRRGELLALRWSDIDLTHRIVTVRDESAKTSKMRHIPINDDLFRVLKAWQTLADTTYVFAGSTGEPLTEVKTAWASVLKAAKIENFRWHDLRHTFASWLVQRGIDLNVVRELMGHASIQMTLRYAHLAPDNKARAVSVIKMPGLLREASATERQLAA
jgi:integrase